MKRGTHKSKTRGIGGHHKPNRGATDDWLTPPAIIKAMGKFDLDPCCPQNMPWETAAEMWTEQGLGRPWFGRVWLNPPYGAQTHYWLRKLAEQ